MGIAIVPFTATVAGVTNAFARIMWGSVSDRFGREYTMAFAFALEGVLIFLMTQIMGMPLAFMILMPFVFLAWGEIYALFSAITGDVFGPKNASGNYGILYTAKGLASILAGWGAAAVAAVYAGSFTVPYYIAGAFDIIAAVLALLRPEAYHSKKNRRGSRSKERGGSTLPLARQAGSGRQVSRSRQAIAIAARWPARVPAARWRVESAER